MMLQTYHLVAGQMKIDIYNHITVCEAIHKQWFAVADKYDAEGFHYGSRSLTFKNDIPHGFRNNGLPNKSTLIGKQVFSELAALPDYPNTRDILIKLGANNSILNPRGSRTYIEYPHIFDFRQTNIILIMLIGDDCPLRIHCDVGKIEKWEFEKHLFDENDIRASLRSEAA